MANDRVVLLRMFSNNSATIIKPIHWIHKKQHYPITWHVKHNITSNSKQLHHVATKTQFQKQKERKKGPRLHWKGSSPRAPVAPPTLFTSHGDSWLCFVYVETLAEHSRCIVLFPMVITVLGRTWKYRIGNGWHEILCSVSVINKYLTHKTMLYGLYFLCWTV